MAEYHAYLQALQPFSGEIEILYDEPMARHTTFRIGGPADIFLRPRSVDALRAVICEARAQGVPCTVLGNGSNVLAPDAGLRGVVVCTGGLRGVEAGGQGVRAGAGALLSGVAKAALEASLTGLEFAAGIPGSAGGAVFMNAGAYGGQMADVVREVAYLDGDGALRTCAGAGCGFGYRTSVFKAHPDWTVVSVTLGLAPGDPASIRTQMEDLAQRRRDKQPLDLPSAGSTFKRPEGYFAGKLIQDAGLRGAAIGGAQVSEKHAGFIVNRGGATSADVRALVSLVQRTVLERFGVALECEVRFL
ncbi:UDP-N-acetylmuramate dehydrogenase [Intestinibacillus massiliensis]|nr:UDP-N-acetylmuramate dehydrogenase [Intestinibacillus massiliensis]